MKNEEADKAGDEVSEHDDKAAVAEDGQVVVEAPEQAADAAAAVGAELAPPPPEAAELAPPLPEAAELAPPPPEAVEVAPPPPAAAPERVADPQLKAVIEALVFASPEPLTPKMLFKLLENEPKDDVELAIRSLLTDWEERGGLQMVEVAGGYQIVTRPEMHEWVRSLFHERKTQKLSVQALETLAVIAYKQPVTGPEIAEIRGVNTAGVLSTLLERHLVKIAGRKAVVGRPFLYATTREFLIRFGLRDLSDLPKVEDLADVLGFEPPAGLADSPTEGRLPLEVEGEPQPGAAPEDAAEDEGTEPEQVH